MDDKIYYCENCGGVMEFDVESQSLKCPNCDTVVPIINDKSRIVEHSLTRRALQSIRAEEKTSHTMECRGCGAKIEVDATSTATECPYCGSDYVLAGKQEDAILPDGVLPFQVDKNRVGELFRRWMKGRWLAPGELKHLYQKDRLQGIYIPYWTFDAKAAARYTAMGGRHRTVTRRGADGKEVREVVTDWYPTSGNLHHFFDDILVCASDKMESGLLRRVGSYGTQQMASYTPEYLSGYGAECYTEHHSAFSPTEKVTAVDTTGAGDGFIGAFLFCMARDGITVEDLSDLSSEKMTQYLTFANKFCGKSVTKHGAIASYPSLAEME